MSEFDEEKSRLAKTMETLGVIEVMIYHLRQPITLLRST